MSIVLIIIGITCIMSFMAFRSDDLMNRWIMRPYTVKHGNQWYRFITSGFIHANWPHLLINMIVFYSFGVVVFDYYHFYFESRAILFFILLYLGGIILSDLPTYVQHQNHSGYASLGASGAVSSVTFAFVLMEPRNMILFMGIIPMPAILWGVAYLAYSHYMSFKGGDNINHSAHFTGAVFGVIYTLILRPEFAVDFANKLLGTDK